MKTDYYTKTVLTIIAISLTLIVFKNIQIIPQVEAGNNVSYGMVPINADGTITVKLSSHDLLNVNIAEISTNDELDINIDEIGGMWVSSGGPLAVKVKN